MITFPVGKMFRVTGGASSRYSDDVAELRSQFPMVSWEKSVRQTLTWSETCLTLGHISHHFMSPVLIYFQELLLFQFFQIITPNCYFAVIKQEMWQNIFWSSVCSTQTWKTFGVVMRAPGLGACVAFKTIDAKDLLWGFF